jgi:hypothetical protein
MHRHLLRTLSRCACVVWLTVMHAPPVRAADAAAAAAPASPEGIAKAVREHWAFKPVGVPTLPDAPAGSDPAWAANPVDRFILASLHQNGLQPSPAAERHTLLRRVTYDLTGLPPTPEELDAFLADASADAFATVVDRLLASPAYGEHWGRHWLDVARYADTKGYVFFEENNFPWSYTYRDYVIRAFNEDLPYDRFIVEQLAADRLPLGDDKRALAAMGFLTLGARFMNNPHDVIDDRIDVVTRGLLGLTVSCARCHDHKFDPIPTADYYALYGVFAGSQEPTVPPLLGPPPQTPEYAAFAAELAAREAKLREFVVAKHAELVSGARRRAGEYMLAARELGRQPDTDDFMLIADGGDCNPKMVLRWLVFLRNSRKQNDPVFAPWHALAELPEAEFAARAGSVVASFGGGGATAPADPAVLAALAAPPVQSMADVAARYGTLFREVDQEWQAAVRQCATTGQPAPTALPDPTREPLRRALYGPDAPAGIPVPAVGDLTLLPDRASQDVLKQLLKAVETHRATGPGAPPRAMSLVDAPSPYEPRVFQRGNPNNLGAPAPRQFLVALAGPQRKPFTDGSGRLELAHAIASPANPLTARVMVNRVWAWHFGQGLVRTPSDFGLRGESPTHPELLDYLASSFVRDGWSVKKLHRLILTSRAYGQRSDDRPECVAADPENRLAWRANRRRLGFEATRDSLLAAAGTLDRAAGGPAVDLLAQPYAARRAVYGFIDRLALPGTFRTFDFPSPDASSPQRDVTTVAPQALFLMNSPFVAEAARKLSQRPDVVGEREFARRVERMFRLLFARTPEPEESVLAEMFFGDAAGREDPGRWERYAHALLLTNEFVFID